MSWLRIDDGFTSNSKIAQLTDAQFRVWIRLLCHCAKSRDPSVDRVAIREVSGLTSQRIRTYFLLGLLDESGDSYEVHNWGKYLPKEEQNAARQAKYRARHRNAGSNATSNAGVDESRDADPSCAHAGTRGFPSRPVPSTNSGTAPETDREPQAEPPPNGSGSGLGDEEGPTTLAPHVANILARARPDEDDPWPT